MTPRNGNPDRPGGGGEMPDFSEYRYAEFEYRQGDGENTLGTIAGTIIRYGDKATFPWGTEEIEPGAFGALAGQDLYVNRMHERSQPIARTPDPALVITDGDDAMRAEIKLPKSSAWAQMVDDEVRRGVLRGLSLEFRVKTDEIEGIDKPLSHRRIKEATMYGFGVVDRPAYPRSTVQMRDYLASRGSSSGSEDSDNPAWAQHGHYDELGRYIIDGIMPMEPEYEGLEERQMPRLRGRLPYNVAGIVSMARNEHVLFLPGAFSDSLGGEILALVGNNYDDPLGGVAQRSLTFQDSDEALEFRTGRIPETSVNRDFVAKLRGGFVRGVTAGWALQGSQTRTEDIEGGGKRIIVEKAMLCELRFRTRSAFPGESVQASRRSAPLLYRAV